METTVRKSFVFDKEVAKQLEELAKSSKKSMTSIVQELIRERYKRIKAKRRFEAFHRIKGSATGLFTDKSIQSIKAHREL